MSLLIQSFMMVFWVSLSMSQTTLGFFNGETATPAHLDQLVSNVHPGKVVIIGEQHGNSAAQFQQLQILQAIRNKGMKVSVGMEFLTYTDQELLEKYRTQQLDEESYLKAIKWGSPSFDYYRPQVLFPILEEGSKTLALNAPRKLSSKIAKEGLDSISTEELKLFPPSFSIGRDSYKLRFKEVSPHFSDPTLLNNYFAAQSLWDDTMAWNASEFIKANPDQVLVIIVGEFHVQYGGGLPDRLAHRGVQNILTITQLDHQDYSEEELVLSVIPSQKFGPRSNFVWVY